MRTYHLNRGTLWLFHLQPYKNHSRTHYYEKYKGHVSRMPEYLLVARGKLWKYLGV